MPYIDTNARTTKPTSNEQFITTGRFPSLFGVFVGFVKGADDVQKNGRLRVWIPEFGTAPEEEHGWVTVNYCAPFAGSTNVETSSKSDFKKFEGTETSYGFWMVPPDINNQVLVMFVGGDPARGIWIGSLYNQFLNNMVPGMAADKRNYAHPNRQIPVAEYNKWDTRVTNPDLNPKPYQKTKFMGVGNQGLITDVRRGVTTSGARREAPSNVFGIITPGPVVDTKASPNAIRRKGGSSFIMDDGTGTEYVELATKSGAKIRLDETNGFTYMINRDGTAWVQMDQKGNIDVFGAGDFSVRAQRDINFRADRNINIEAGQNLYLKAAKDTKQEKTIFTYDVNNIPATREIPVWAYKGAGKGDGGTIVFDAGGNIHSTAKEGTFITSNGGGIEMNAGGNIDSTSGAEMNISAKQGIKMTTIAALDVYSKGNVRFGTNGTWSQTSQGDMMICTEGSMNQKSCDDYQIRTEKRYRLRYISSSFDADPKIGQKPLYAQPAPFAQVKPLNMKTNVLATWCDPDSKFYRNAQQMRTTVSRLATYEPCPEHEGYLKDEMKPCSATTVGCDVTCVKASVPAPVLSEADSTYNGSSGPGGGGPPPPPNTDPGADNTSVTGDTPEDSNVSKDINLSALRCQLIYHEGYKDRSYKDSLGYLTGGIGHLMRTNEIPNYPVGTPLPPEQIETWYNQDSSAAMASAAKLIGPSWSEMSDVRKRAVVDLAYNLGETKLSKFPKFLAAARAGKWDEAGAELKDSKWYTQVGRRGPNIVTMITKNVDPTGCSTK